jgi:flagellar L-ring protein precursor FlgH
LGNPFLDRVARSEGDLLTILISESSSASLAAATSASKTDSNSVDPLRFFSWLTLVPQSLNTGAKSSNQGQGQTSQSGRLTARVTVTVKKVLDNGTMLIEGRRTVVINKETQTFLLSGLVRIDDVRQDNTVLSERIGEAEIRMEGKGLLNERQRRGILTKILDWLF